MKFQRTFEMKVQGRFGSTYTFTYPLTCIFDISSRAASGVNTARFMLYNLSPAVRSDIEFDSAIDIDAGGGTVRRAFQFRAGYVSESYQPILFQGNIRKAFYYREGPDVITEIEVSDGLSAIQKSQINTSTPAGWTGAAEAQKLVSTMKQHGVTLGAVGSLFNTLRPTRGVKWLGSTWDVLKALASAQGGYACINLEKLYLMGPEDTLVPTGGLKQLDASTGLIGTPRRSGWIVDAQMIFEPRVQLMQQIKVLSSVNPSIRGTFTVMAISHRGIISGAKDGGVITALSLQGQPKPFILVAPQ